MSDTVLDGFNENLVRKDETPMPTIFDRISVDSLLTDGALSSQKILNLEANKITVIGGKIEDGVISGADAWNAKVDSGDLGNMAFEDLVEASKLGTTIVEGGYLKTILIDAQYITAGTIVGRTFKATNGIGSDIWIQNNGVLSFRYGGENKATAFSDTNGDFLLEAENNLFLTGNSRIYLTSHGVLSLQANSDGGSDNISFVSNGSEIGYFSSEGDFVAAGNIKCLGTFKSSDGSSGGNYSSYGFITSIRASGGHLEAKYREITVKDGIVTNISSETGWNNMGSY